jgi:4-diphosphocytidyl-2-C-methyl-D-erythritol kinase
MVVFPNAKINIGLNVTSKRNDGFHNLETVFYPIRLTDILEFTVTETTTRLRVSGVDPDIPENENIVMKAYRKLAGIYHLPYLGIYLHKIIPLGAGLGGGSSDASFMLKALNDFFTLHIPFGELLKYAGELGSDCPFFIQNKPVFAEGTGNILTPIELDLSEYIIMIVKPNIHVPTKLAFQNIQLKDPEFSLLELVKLPVEDWKNKIVNDFETSIFKSFPEIGIIKQLHYSMGAVYAQMSGSGSAVYGLYKSRPEIPKEFAEYFIYLPTETANIPRRNLRETSEQQCGNRGESMKKPQ